MLSSKTEILSMGYVPSPVLGTQQEISRSLPLGSWSTRGRRATSTAGEHTAHHWWQTGWCPREGLWTVSQRQGGRGGGGEGRREEGGERGSEEGEKEGMEVPASLSTPQGRSSPGEGEVQGVGMLRGAPPGPYLLPLSRAQTRVPC